MKPDSSFLSPNYRSFYASDSINHKEVNLRDPLIRPSHLLVPILYRRQTRPSPICIKSIIVIIPGECVIVYRDFQQRRTLCISHSVHGWRLGGGGGDRIIVATLVVPSS